jgi:hypothetical protein
MDGGEEVVSLLLSSGGYLYVCNKTDREREI